MPCGAVFVFFEVIMSDKRHEARYQRRKLRREMKRESAVGRFDDFGRVADAGNLCDAFRRAKRGVAWKESVQRYEANLLMNVSEAKRRLITGGDVRRGFVEFDVNERGKIRHIKSIHISERVIQKCLCNEVLLPVLRRPLIHDNGASIKGKGISFSIKRLTTHLRRFYRENGNSNEGYALQIDFRKFFDSIDHAILERQLADHITDSRVLNLLHDFISAFGPEKSLGLGSEVSQICAVFFPNSLDHCIKEEWRIKYFGRYNDDSYIIHRSKEFLRTILWKIRQICASLKITLNLTKTRIVKLSHGVCFLKGRYILSKTGKIIKLSRGAVLGQRRRKLRKFQRLVSEGKMSMAAVRTSYQSWRGNFKRRFNEYDRVRRMDKFYNELFIYNRAFAGAHRKI